MHLSSSWTASKPEKCIIEKIFPMRYLQLSTSEYNPSLKKRRSLYPKLKVSSAGCQAHLAENDLWSQIFWGATQCPGPALHTFGKAKICNLKGDKEQ